MTDTLHAALLFLISTLFDLYLFILMVRVMLVFVQANYFDPITQFVSKLTNFLVKPLRRFIPNVGRIELASVVLILVLELIKFSLLLLLNVGLPHLSGLIILAIGDFIKLILQIYFYSILFQVILSWLQPHSPINRTLYQFNSPIMRPIQRIVPPISGIDISPIPALILLQFLIIILVNPLMAIGLRMAIS